MTETKIALSKIIFDEAIYPRMVHDPAKVQEYAENIESIEEKKNYIILSANNKLLDGRHRHLAYLKNADGKDIEIPIYILDKIKERNDEYLKSIELNSSHGQQLSREDKKRCAINLYNSGYTKETIANRLSITIRTVMNYVKNIDDKRKEERKQRIFDMWMQCNTSEEISNVVDITRQNIDNYIKDMQNLEKFPKFAYLQAKFEESDFKPPLYNIWSFNKKTNGVSHFGNSEQQILDNLLYLYTEPFDIVVDPFAGGGSTIDICKKRLRRYFISDRKPIVEREHEIRKLDIVKELPNLYNRWSDVSLTYLDPPYWKQAEGKYSNDKEDLANQSLKDFTNNITSVINEIGKKQSKGVIALLMQPTQWNNDKQFTDHIFDIINKVNLKVEMRISCPYSTEQYTPQMVNWAKENKKLLVLTRELIIWRLNENL